MPRPKIDWLKTLGVALMGGAMLWAVLAKCIPLILLFRWRSLHP